MTMPKRRPIAIEGTVFAPSETEGVYVKDDESTREELAVVSESKTSRARKIHTSTCTLF